MDQDSAFMSSLMTHLLDKFNIKIKTVAPYTHLSLQAEHGFKLLSLIMTKHVANVVLCNAGCFIFQLSRE